MRPSGTASSHQLVDGVDHDHPDDFGIAPPTYEKATQPAVSKWNPKTWTKKTKIIAGSVMGAILLIIIIVAAVEGAKNGSYPDYSPLNYSLQDTYAGSGFFDDFDFFTGYDPTHGLVHYVPQATANSTQFNLTTATDTSAVMKVDTSDGVYDTATGRYSVRITSKKQYNSGLFVFDILHSPYGCGTWPAVWLSDPSNWPQNGEIDVVESVNQGNSGNQATLHTSSGCKMDVKRKETGKALVKNCDANSNDGSGCGVQGPKDTFGATLNANGGGTYAMEWRDAGIRVWFFGRGDLPADLPSDASNTTVNPDPSTWPEALADFPSTNCDISSHFKNQSIIANIDLCGDWAGSTKVYSDEDSCPGTCASRVAGAGSNFDNAYWEFKSFRVYSAS